MDWHVFCKPQAVEAAAVDFQKLRDWRQKARERNLAFIDYESSEYPSLLKEIPAPPLLLFYRGNLALLKEQMMLAVVGTRYPSTYGLGAVSKLVRDLSDREICVISGMARGIDAAAHQAVLNQGGKTIGILGQGLDFKVPYQQALYDRMAESGLLLTEYWPEQVPAVWTFPRRNRIIAGLSRGTVVVEGRFESGAMITGKLAVDFNREVFALPGMIQDPRSEGPHWLIQNGAKLVHQSSDILEELGINASAAKGGKTPQAPEEYRELLQAIGFETVDIEALSLRTRLPMPMLGSRLLELELKGWVEELPGKNYRLLNR